MGWFDSMSISMQTFVELIVTFAAAKINMGLKSLGKALQYAKQHRTILGHVQIM